MQKKNRVDERLNLLSARKEKTLALFITAGYPHLDSTVQVVLALERGGADIIEIGMPFSDPLADGPVIQQSSTAAIRNGMTLARLLEDVVTIRAQSGIPIVLMGYLNPILRYGPDRFFEAAGRNGVDGVILPELPLEEAGRYSSAIHANGLAQILLVTPATPPERIRAIDQASDGFLYCVSTTGVTGAEGSGSPEADIREVRKNASKNRVLVGFGIARPEDAARYAQEADGVIVGSALIKKIGEGSSLEALSAWVREFKEAVRRT